MGFAPKIPASQYTVLGKRSRWLLVQRMALWDRKKVYNPENYPLGGREKSTTCTSIKKSLKDEFPARLIAEGLSLPKPINEGRSDYFFKCSDTNVKLIRNAKNQGHMTLPKE